MRTNGTPNGPAACASSHRQRRKWWTALAVLAVLVVLGTVAALTMPASTMSVADMATPETAAADAENGQAADAPAQDSNATAPAENTPDETAPAATPAPATPESAAPAEAEYTAALGEGADALNVVVTAPAGAFDEGVEPVLQVTALESEQDLQAIAAELDGHEVAYDGFAALDITFTDAQGQEIEPKLPVKVRMELPQAVVDSGIDLTTLTVQHLAEDDQGNVTSVDQVASVAGNTITLSDAAAAAVNEAAGIATMSINALTAESTEAPVVAEFEVDGFSSFVITWDKYFEITVHYVNESGEDINGTSKKVTIKKDESIYFADLAETTVNGLEYKRAAYSEDKRYDDSDKTVTHITADSGTIFGSGARWVEFYNETETVKTIYQGNFGGWGTGTQKADVYLVYGEPDQGGDNPGGGDSGSTEANVTVGKSAVLDQETGNYTLELSVTGDQGSEENPAKVDVLLVVDKSGSMKYDLDSQSGSDRERMKAVVTAVKTLTDTLDANNKVDVRYDLVTFSSLDKDYTSEDKNTSWTANSNVINDAVSYYTETGWNGKFSHDLEGGTNYQYAFYKAKQALNSSRGDAQQIVIFLTDGIPTHKGLYSESQDNSNGEDTWYPEFHNTDAAINELRGLNADAFYCIGVGEVFDEASDPNNAKNGKANLERIVTAAKSQGLNSDLYTASSTENLQDIFRKIAGSTTFFAANNVVMTDPLSQYADIVPNADGNWDFTVTIDDGETPQTIPVTVEKEKGSATFTFTDSAGTKQTATVEYIESTKNIKLTFPAAYQLEEGYTYSISTTITPSQTAKDAGMGSGAAQMTPEENTGTHWEQKDENGNPEKGFWSNDIDNAKVTYKAITTDENGNETSSTEGFAMFPKPVIRVQEETTANLTIVKNIYGLSQDQVVNLVNGEYQTQCDKGDHTHGLRFDVDYFGNEEDAKNDNWDNEKNPNTSFIDDWTFDVKQTLDASDAFVSGTSDTEWDGDIQESVDLDTPKDEEGKSYTNSSLTYVANEGGEPYYRYTITIKDANLNDWYHVWETNTEVTGYDLAASVKAEKADGEIPNIAENKQNGQATAFQLTDDTMVTFTNRYTHSPVTVNFKKVDATNKTQGLAGAQFKLFYTDEDNVNHYYTDTTGPSGSNWTMTEEDATVFTSEDGNTLGTLTLPELEVGRTYFLTEVTAPDGYQLLTQNIKIVVGTGGDIDAVEYVGGAPLDKVGGDQGSTDTTTPPTYLIPNTTGVELPETGGRGTNFLTIGGLLMMAAAAGGYVLRRRRGKEAR